MKKTTAAIRYALTSLAFVAYVSSAVSATPEEDLQDRAYVQCMIKRHVDPPEISKEDDVACLLEARIEDPGEGARQVTGVVWRSCIIGKALDLDDGISPAEQIGRAVIPFCREEWKAYVRAKAMPPMSKRTMANGLEIYAVDEGIRAVLYTRREMRKMRTN